MICEASFRVRHRLLHPIYFDAYSEEARVEESLYLLASSTGGEGTISGVTKRFRGY
jgi:hypothetical protein